VKRVVLFNPVEGHKLHWVNDDAHPHFRQALVWPRLNLQNQSEFPDFLGAKALQVVLHPGDMLLIPALWLHYLEAKSPVASDNAGETSLPFWLNVNSFAAYTASVSEPNFPNAPAHASVCEPLSTLNKVFMKIVKSQQFRGLFDKITFFPFLPLVLGLFRPKVKKIVGCRNT